MNSDSVSPSTPSVQAPCESGLPAANRLLQETARIHSQAKQAVQALEEKRQDLQRTLNEAWKEKQEIEAVYFGLLRHIATLRQDCLARRSNSLLDWNWLDQCLTSILSSQGVETLPTAPGDAYNPEFQECVDTVSVVDLPANSIYQIVDVGFGMKLPNGQYQTLKASKVVVNKASTETKRSPC
jgi:molecular chaperone GrpE (heat shock protein)